MNGFSIINLRFTIYATLKITKMGGCKIMNLSTLQTNQNVEFKFEIVKDLRMCLDRSIQYNWDT